MRTINYYNNLNIEYEDDYLLLRICIIISIIEEREKSKGKDNISITDDYLEKKLATKIKNARKKKRIVENSILCYPLENRQEVKTCFIEHIIKNKKLNLKMYKILKEPTKFIVDMIYLDNYDFEYCIKFYVKLSQFLKDRNNIHIANFVDKIVCWEIDDNLKAFILIKENLKVYVKYNNRQIEVIELKSIVMNQ